MTLLTVRSDSAVTNKGYWFWVIFATQFSFTATKLI